MAEYDLGDVVRVTGTWTNAAGTATDPAAVYFKYMDPSRNVTALVYDVDDEVVKSATGIYYVDVDGDEVGRWFVRLYSTGAGKAAEESYFDIVKSEFPE
jgi:hypothetical protein